MRLSEVEPGSVVKVRRITGGPKARLLTMGITHGVVLKVVKRAPLGDPIEVELRGYNLSLRKEEAKYIEVE
ncbi:ferrous iron transport protein A [Thermococci archaeon]|uniref:FeoA family protein n=1 Tax=Palaeococcus sp. (in: euryarchaeotes) TaxID=2820298 RepID=UPI000F29C275|nr:FeoA family protein [Palaeococcus sp. (in: euryarchaeotes)]RLF75922.1 MAG: ferrous iron transport protein A [Thermococci archaeon]